MSRLLLQYFWKISFMIDYIFKPLSNETSSFILTIISVTTASALGVDYIIMMHICKFSPE